MMKLETLKKQIAKNGYPVEEKTIVKADGTKTPCLIVRHDYTGPHPNAETLKIHRCIFNMAIKARLRAEQRGHYTATYIF